MTLVYHLVLPLNDEIGAASFSEGLAPDRRGRLLASDLLGP